VTEVKLRQLPDSSGMRAWFSSGWELPWKIESGEQKRCFLTDEGAPELSLRSGIYADVTVGTGESFESNRIEALGKRSKSVDSSYRGSRVAFAMHPDLLGHLGEQALGADWRSRIFVYEVFEND
jgi:hypothetical protein